MRSTPEYNRQKIAITFATSSTTATDTTFDTPNLIHSILLVAHTTAATLTSAGSGAILSIRDEDGNVIKTYAEVVTGTTTLLSADLMLFPNDTIRYAITCREPQCVSGGNVLTSQFPTATVILYKY
jgi:hypothetical protein